MSVWVCARELKACGTCFFAGKDQHQSRNLVPHRAERCVKLVWLKFVCCFPPTESSRYLKCFSKAPCKGALDHSYVRSVFFCVPQVCLSSHFVSMHRPLALNYLMKVITVVRDVLFYVSFFFFFTVVGVVPRGEFSGVLISRTALRSCVRRSCVTVSFGRHPT